MSFFISLFSPILKTTHRPIITTGLSISIQLTTFSSVLLNGRGEKKTLFLFLLFPSHLHRLMLKVCLRIVCNYACLHTEALLCVKVWKPFVAWGCEGKTAQTNFKQLQRHEDRWQTGASWLQTWVILYSNMLLGLCVGFVWADCCSLKCKHIKDRIKGSLGFFSFSFDYPKFFLPGFSSGFVRFLNDSDPDASFSWS